jgi:hypothetical protein
LGYCVCQIVEPFIGVQSILNTLPNPDSAETLQYLKGFRHGVLLFYIGFCSTLPNPDSAETLHYMKGFRRGFLLFYIGFCSTLPNPDMGLRARSPNEWKS